jgi:hypothetical protein
MKYEFMCYDEAGINLITDKFKENLIKHTVMVEEISRSILNIAPDLNPLLLMAKVNAIIDDRKEK